MEIIWKIHLYLLVLWSALRPARGILEDHYIRVPHIPHATIETTIPYYVNSFQCSRRCLLKPSCQGFYMMALGQTESCVLLQGFTGIKTIPGAPFQAYVSTYFNGNRYILRTASQTWDDGLAYCQGLGMTLMGYPKSQEESVWMNAVSSYLLIGVEGNGSDYIDINTGNVVVAVNWEFGYPLADPERRILRMANEAFANIYAYAYGAFSIICSPTN